MDPPRVLAATDLGAAGLVGLAALGLLVLGLLYGRPRRVLPNPDAMTFLQHAKELQTRLLRVTIQFALWSTLFLVLRFHTRPSPLGLAWPSPVIDVFDNTAARIYVAVAHDVVPDGVRLLVSRPTEAVGAQLQVGFLLAFILTLPALLFETWAFFGPGLTVRERRVVAASLPVAGGLFVAGAAFAYVLITPLLLEVFYRFATPIGAEPFLAAGSLVATVITFAFLFGVAFQLPLVLVLLVRLRITTPSTYVRYWRHVTVAVFAVAALATDPTLLSQLIVGAVLLALYWGGVLASVLLRPPGDKHAARSDARSKPS